MKSYYHSVGRRKRSIARVYLKIGNGLLKINSKNIEEYFPRCIHKKIFSPIDILSYKINQFDIKISVFGGGINGQVEAIRLAISRIFCNFDKKNRKKLKEKGLLTRDAREVERKKFGQKKARKKYQFSKR